MDMLRDLYKTTQLNEKSKDLSKLSPDVMSDIQKNIRDGAQDLEQKWANALELVHKAYEVAGVQRPTPDMEDAWKQYEENIQYAVNQLKETRGMDGEWRMSAAMFHDALQVATTGRPLHEVTNKLKNFRVTVNSGSAKDTYTVQAQSIDDVVESIKEKDTKLHDVNVQRPNPRTAIVRFSKFSIKRNISIRIEQVRQM